MIKNLGSADKVIRIILALGIGAAGVYFKSWWGLVAIVPLATAFIGTCPIYLPFGIKTHRSKSA